MDQFCQGNLSFRAIFTFLGDLNFIDYKYSFTCTFSKTSESTPCYTTHYGREYRETRDKIKTKVPDLFGIIVKRKYVGID